MSSYQPKTVFLSLYDVAILLANLHRALHDPLVGFEDADHTLTEIELALRKRTTFPIEVIESVLWAANLLNEKGAFFHPKNEKFEDWQKKILPKHDFDPIFNTIEAKP